MDRQYLLHMMTAAKNLSPFDVNMAYDAGWSGCTPYINVELNEVEGLVQDAIFSRGPKGVKRTAIFFGGRDAFLAMDMMEQARNSMVPPFEVSLFADPSGAFTTAAAMVACVDRLLRDLNNTGLKGLKAVIFGGTGPVGSTAAVLAAQAGAESVIVSHHSREKAESMARLCNERYSVALSGGDGSSESGVTELLEQADVVFNAARAGVRVVNSGQLAVANKLQVVCDVNAVPPEGIEGLGVMDDAAPLAGSPSGARGIGALVVGNVKYQTQRELLQQMHDANTPQYLDFQQAFRIARQHAN